MSQQANGTRLNKYLASCGVGSRRACDVLIQEGKIFVNNSRCENPATKVGPDDTVRVGRKPVSPRSTEVILLNKPAGLVCTAQDELGRGTIYDILPPKLQHLKNVGRLDKDSEGLLVLTNDGDLALKLTHPGHKVEKEYLVTLNQAFANEVMDQLVKGVHTPEGKAKAKSVRRISPRRVKVVLETGLKRQIRYMFDALHLKVTKLVRIRIGTLQDAGLDAGRWRHLDESEIEALGQNPPQRKVPDDVSRATRRRIPRKAARKTGSKDARKTARKTTRKQGRAAATKTASHKSSRHPFKRVAKKVSRRRKK
ncbi:MAG: pseudouridine synthase [Akkermansiaceae bacterium]